MCILAHRLDAESLERGQVEFMAMQWFNQSPRRQGDRWSSHSVCWRHAMCLQACHGDAWPFGSWAIVVTCIYFFGIPCGASMLQAAITHNHAMFSSGGFAMEAMICCSDPGLGGHSHIRGLVVCPLCTLHREPGMWSA